MASPRYAGGFVKGGGERISATRAFGQVSALIAVLPDRFRAAMTAELATFQPRLEARMKAGAPKRKGPPPSIYERHWRPAGGAATLLSTKLDAKELRLSAGLLTQDAASRGFTLYVLDAGRGLKNSRSRPRRRLLPGGENGRLIGKWITVDGKKQKIRQRTTLPYTRAISPILPTDHNITFGAVRYWARGEIGPVLTRVYDLGLRDLARSDGGKGR